MNSANRQLNLVFCDDVRFELGNKVSYIGVYNGTMELPGTAPVTIAKMCIATTSITSIDSPFKMLHLNVFLDDVAIQKIEVPEEYLAMSLKETAEPWMKYISIGAVLTVQPFNITGECRLKVTATTENGEELDPPGLKIRFVGDKLATS